MEENKTELSKLLRKKRYTRFYILGFVDAEGCFSIAIKKQDDARFGWVLDPIFQVTQHKNSRSVLELIKNELVCGRIIEKSGQPDTLVYLVDNRRQLAEKIIPFFEKYKLITKNGDFEKFKEVVNCLENKEHKNLEQFKHLVRKVFEMNFEGKQRRYAIDEILHNLKEQDPQRLNARHPE
ncbi:MAG TPA: LAGLIDADG family homing endonuclease [archaeon]|nr:LAGLIDADG family homing endonuclease [archaeon]